MIYKSIFLTLFLAPFAMAGDNTKNARIQELQKMISQKEQAIFDLGNMIAQKDDFFSTQKQDCQNRVILLIDQRVKQLEKENSDKLLSQENKTKVDIEVRRKVVEFVRNFFEAVNSDKAIEGSLTESLFQEDATNSDLSKFYFVRLAITLDIISHLVRKYENLIKEYSLLINELIDLQKI